MVERHTTRWKRGGFLFAVLCLLSLLPTTGGVLLSTDKPAAAAPIDQVQAAAPAAVPGATGTLPVPSREWFKQLQNARPQDWLKQYCAAPMFQSVKMCLIAEAAGQLGKTHTTREARVAAMEARINGLRTELTKAGLLPGEGSPAADPPGDRIPSEEILVPSVQPSPSGGGASGTHILEYALPTAQSFPIDIKLGPDGALWFSMITNNGTPGIGRIDPSTKAMAMFALPMETGITYAVNGGPGPYIWWTTIPFEGFGNKVGRINIITHEVENWEIPTPYSYPADLKVGPDGAIWFTETRGSRIGRFDPDTHKFDEYEVTPPGVPNANSAEFLQTLPQDLAVIEDQGQPADTVCEGTPPSWEPGTKRWKDVFDGGACNATGIWFSNQSPYANGLGRIDPYTKEMSYYPYPTPAGLVLDISPGKDGRTVWYWYMGARYGGWYDPVSKVFTQIPTPTPPFLCCGGAGADNAMYWGEAHANTIARYDLATKTLSHVPVPSPRAIIIDFQVAAGTVWYAEYRANRIAEVVPDQRQELTKWPCGCAAPAGHPFNPDPINYLLEASRPGGVAHPSAW
jgi:virginiamycin B lyase